jgi:hypothetical protein
MNTVTQAIIPQLGESVKSSHLYSLAEAFNSRILSGAGDSHWRIPYYIFSTFFRKPRLDDNMLYTPESEFFDFYQFVNPSTRETWPTNPPQEPEGANLQTNFLNRFIFGMNYQTKDKDGNWIYEREDIRVQKAQNNLKGDPTLFRGFIFPFFTAVGTTSGTDREYTSFGLSSEIYSNGYISGKPENPQGNSFGGYYGKNPLINDPVGCGSDSVTGYQYPMSTSSVIKIDGLRNDKKNEKLYINVCNEGKGDLNPPSEYTLINDKNLNNILAFKINENIPVDVDISAKNKYHLNQFQSTVFFGREQKNHIHRLLYNYITYAKGFDFDWFFNNQYSCAPEIGSFKSIVSTYDQNPDGYYGRLNLLSTDIKILESRLTLEKTDFSASKINNGEFNQNGTTAITITFTSNHSYNIGDSVFISFYNSSGLLLKTPVEGYYAITGKTNNTITVQGASSITESGIVDIRNFLPIISGYNVKTIDDSAFIKTQYYNQDGKTLVEKDNITGRNPILSYLLNNDFLAKGMEYISEYLYTYDNNDPDKVFIPLGFALNNVKINSTTIKKFTLTVHYYVNGVYANYRDIKIDFTTLKNSTDPIYKAISGDIFLATTTPEIVYSVKFEVRDIEILSPNSTASVTLQPIFLFAYKPKIEDAYALLRTCTYNGLKDGDLDDSNHQLNSAYKLSNKLKEAGVLENEDIVEPDPDGIHTPLSFELNNNALYEASRRLSLYARIVKPDNFIEILDDDKTLRFKRYAMQSPNTRGPTSSKVKYSDVSSSLTIPYGVFIKDDVVNHSSIPNYLITWTSLDPVYYSKFKRYNFLYEGENNKINAKLNNDLIASLSTSINSIEYPTRVNSNNVEFQPTKYSFDYDAVIEGTSGNYLYYQFEDQYGVKFNSGDEDAPNYYAKRYTSENLSNTLASGSLVIGKQYGVYGGSILHDGQKFESNSVFTAINTNYSVVNENPLIVEIRYLDSNTNTITLDQTDIDFIKKNFYIYVFTRVPNPGGLASGKEAGYQFYHINKSGSFVTRTRTDLWKYNYSGTQAIKMSNLGDLDDKTLSDSAYFYNLTCPNKSPIVLYNANSEPLTAQDVTRFYDLDLPTLTSIANVLYNNYKTSNIQLTADGSSVEYKGNASFNQFSTFTVEEYNKYLAGYKIYISYFKNYDEFENTQNLDNSTVLNPTIIKFIVYNSNNTVSKTFLYSMDSFIELPKLENNESYFKLEITVNNYRSNKTQEPVDLNVYLSIINAKFLDDDPVLESINREGGVLIERTAKLINTDTAAPTSRDIFQGIAPSIDNVLTGSLLVGQEYKVSGGTILHNGQLYGVGYSSTFIAKNTQYSITSGTTPLIIQNNGIIEIAPPSGFSNEWAFWINFLPYSEFPTSSFKEEVYGATNSPFIDRCHINSSAIIKSEAENLYFNLGLPKTYIPEMPPSYRYVPLLTKRGLIYENMVGNSVYKDNFYRACPAFKPPYKIKKAYVSSADSYASVYIELDRKIDGHSISQSATPSETYRTDYNGLKDWTAPTRGLSFRLGDASLTNAGGFNQVVSNTSNGYQGSYYPRFFFVKLIPKPYSDKNDTGEDVNDSPLNHDAIKQAELYLEAMREGFTANSSASRGRLSCANIKGHLTPPDYKYDQLLINSTTTNEYFGNKWPSLLTSSINFNLAPLRNEDNPRGFGAIPFIGTYLEPYAAIAESINNLVNFRVPFPLNVLAEVTSYSKAEALINAEWNPGDQTITRSFAGGVGPIWSTQQSPQNVSDITSPIYGTTTIYNLRNDEGALTGAGAAQSYSVVDSDVPDFNINLAKASIGKSYIKSKITVTGIDSGLKSIAYSDIFTILPSIYSLPALVTKQKSINKLVPVGSLPSSSNCSEYYTIINNGNPQYYKLESIVTDASISCESITSVEVLPEDLLVGKPFYRRVNPLDCDGPGSNYGIISFETSSSINYSIFDTGFQIVNLNIKNFDPKDIT